MGLHNRKMGLRRLVTSYLILAFLALFFIALLIELFIQAFNLIGGGGADQHFQAIHLRRIRSTDDVNVIPATLERNCTPAAIEQFPRPFFTQNQRLSGAIAIHVFTCLYTFYALAIVCDEYFVPSLECISDFLKIKPDVAGATLMAAGSSAPELATAIIAVFVTKDDIGVGTVVGSAVYNIAFVVAVCGLFAGKVVQLTWWPMVRDAFFYLLSIFILMYTLYVGKITWIHSVVFLLGYALYIAFMFVNESVENWVTNLPMFRFLNKNGPNEQAQLVSFKNYELCGNNQVESSSEGDTIYSTIKHPESAQDVEWKCTMFERPKGSCLKTCLWLISLPVYVFCFISIPDCRRPTFKKCFFITFFSSCVWIGFMSYILVWMITIIGYTSSIPDTVMGLTFLAAGVSVPDAVASLIVAREGQGDMAISNAIGSNIFDILLCLGLPWFIQTVIIKPGSTIKVISKGMTYTTICLLSTVFFLLFSVHMNGWKLTKKFGAVMMAWYILFMVCAGLYEGNVFGLVNLPTCHSDY